MPKYSCLFISAALIALLTVSCFFVNLKPARACPVDPPETLLQLYMESELAMVADVEGEKILKQEDPNEWGYGADIRKDLRPVKVYKGNSPRDFSFETWEFFNRTTNDDGTSNGNEERSNALLPGKRYLLFFNKNEKSGAYELVDTPSASRELEAADEALYDKRISELAAILKAGKDQLPRLTEWLVKLTEEPATLYHGASDLARSFYALHHQDTEEEEDGEEMAPFQLTEYSQVSLPDIAESLTDSQKQRISSVLERNLHDALASVPGGDGETGIDYDLVGLVSYWDRRQLTIGANALLMNSDPTDSHRVSVLMELITYAVDDEELNSLWERYREAAEDEISDDEADGGAAARENADAPVPESGGGEKSAEPDNAANSDEAVTKAGEDAAAAKKVRLDRLMKELVGKFSDRYQYMLAKDFTADENDEETADEVPETPQDPQEIKKLRMIADPMLNRN